MTEAQPKAYDLESAVALLQAASIPAVAMFSWFKVTHADLDPRALANCSCEHDALIDLSIWADDTGRIEHYSRFDFTEVAHLLKTAYAAAGPDPSPLAIIRAIREADRLYDYESLRRRHEQWMADFPTD